MRRIQLLLSLIAFVLLVSAPSHAQVASVSPASGWEEGNTNVTLSGSGFQPGASVWLRQSGPDIVGFCDNRSAKDVAVVADCLWEDGAPMSPS